MKLSFGPAAEFIRFSGFEDSPTTLGLGGEANYALSKQWAVGAKVAFGNMDQSVDTPGGANLLPVNTFWAELTLTRNLFAVASFADLFAVTGIGITRLTRESFSVPLGALGSYELPELTESHWDYLLGVKVAKDIVDGIALSLGSSLRLLDPFSTPELSYSFSGGINIDIL